MNRHTTRHRTNRATARFAILSLAGLLTMVGCSDASSPTSSAVASTSTASSTPTTKAPPLPSLERMVGGLIMTGVDRRRGPTAHVRRLVRQGQVGAVILTDTSSRDARAVVRGLQSSARAGKNPSLIVAVDQEGGLVRRFTTIGPSITQRELGRLAPARTQTEARRAGCALAQQGVTLDLAPVTDVATNRSGFLAQTGRSFGASPTTVAARSTAYVRGMQSAGVGTTLKHFPGLGAAGPTTDDSLRERLRHPRDLPAFRVAARQKPMAVMLSSATYTTGYFRSTRPAFANPAVPRWLRQTGYEGLIITDDLATDAVARDRRVPSPAVAAIRAGADMVMSVETSGATAQRWHRQLVAAVRSGALPKARVVNAWRNVEAARAAQEGMAETARCATTEAD